MDREAWHAAVHGVAKSWTRLSDFTSLLISQVWEAFVGTLEDARLHDLGHAWSL